MNHVQLSEILLTAAQSLLGVVLLASLRLSIGGALLLFGMFIGQFVLPVCSQWFPGLAFGLGAAQIHPVFTAIYVAVATALFLQNPSSLAQLREGLRPVRECCGVPEDNNDLERPLGARCENCEFRRRVQSAGGDMRPENRDTKAVGLSH
jgi:hypothetical protein